MKKKQRDIDFDLSLILMLKNPVSINVELIGAVTLVCYNKAALLK